MLDLFKPLKLNHPILLLSFCTTNGTGMSAKRSVAYHQDAAKKISCISTIIDIQLPKKKSAMFNVSTAIVCSLTLIMMCDHALNYGTYV